MALVFAGICSHGPGITGRADRADPALRDPFYAALESLRVDIEASGAEAIPGAPELSERIITEMMQTVDMSYAKEWRMDHGIMVPLNFLTPRYDMPIIPANINCQGPPLTPLSRAYAFGQALRRACDSVPEKIAVMGTGGISHWPATPNSGKINEEWDRDYLDAWVANDKNRLLAYTDEDTLREAGQGGFEIRTLTAISGLCEGSTGTIRFAEPIPIFSTMCVAGVMNL